MRYTEIAIAKPFEGAPKINLAEAFGASPNKPIILKIPVTGKRPMKYNVLNLPKGLDLADGIIRGQVELEGDYKVTLIVENELGKAQKQLGALVYALHKSGEENDELVKQYIEDIAKIEAQLEEARKEEAEETVTPEVVKFCSKCGREAGADDAFCKNCGSSLKW